MPTELYLALVEANRQIAKLKEQLDTANSTLKSIVYTAEDPVTVAYEYLEQNNLLE